MNAHNAIVESWFQKAVAIYPEQACQTLSGQDDRFRNPVGYTLRVSLAQLVQELSGEMDAVRVAAALEGIVRLRAVQDCTPGEAVCFVFLLREIVREHQAGDKFPDLERRIDDLALTAFEVYVQCREDVALARLNEARRALGVRRCTG